METYLHYSFKDLPATKTAQEELKLLKEFYTVCFNNIESKLRKAEKEFIETRDTQRANAKWEYSLEIHNSANNMESTMDKNIYYCITSKAVNPLEGDTEFYKDRKYQPFRIINNVVLIDGNGYMFKNLKTGDIIINEELALLNNSIVPERFKN